MVNTKLNRAKVLSFFLSIFVLILTSCENFFTDNGLDEKIRAAIDYANAPTSSFWISGDQTMGTITPYGKISYKPTDYQNIKFKLKPDYEFIRWNFRYEEIQSGEKYTREITNQNWWKDYIEIINEEISEPSTTGEITYSLQIKFIKAEENMLIEPICGKKPLVTEWKPADDRLGVSCQSPVYITFDSEIDKESLKDSITILVDGGDYTDCFTAPEIETVDSGSKQYSRISLTPTEILPCPDDESKTAVVTIKLADKIKTKNGVSLTPIQYTYRINSKPLSYSYVDMSDYNVLEGQTIPNTSPLQFAIAKYISLSFKENNGYQFLYWTTNNDNIKFAEDDVTLNPTSFYTMTLINETEKAKISPVCVARPKLKESDFNNKYSGHLNPRDSDIILTFDKNIVIPDDAKFTITCTGKGDVSSSFNAPVASGNTIQISAKKDSNRIEVKPGDALTVTISIPDSLYYVYHDEKTNQDINITIGKNAQEFQPEYKIDSSTQDSATVTFVSTLNDKSTGSINIDNVKNDDKVHEYDIDKEVILNFRPNDDYEFLYWTVSNNNVAIRDIFSASTTLTVKESGVCTVTAKCTPKLKVKLVQPAEAINPCDSDIKLEFNLPPENFTTDGKIGNSLNSISVSYNGSDVMSTCYETPKIEGNYLIIKSKKKLSVPQGATNGVVVKIDGTFHYNYTDTAGVLTETKKIYLADGVYSGSFSVNEKTQKQICVKINVDSNHMQLNTEPFESYKDNSSIYKLNENTEYDLSFTSNENWQFVKWNISGLDATASDSPVSITKTTQFGIDYYKLIVKTAKDGVGTSTNPIIINDDSAQRLALTVASPNNISNGVERDSSIELTFNKKPDDSIKQKIQITIDGYSVADSFNLNAATFTGNKLTISPNLSNRISVSAGTTRKVKILIPADSYYTYPENATAGTATKNITCGRDYVYEYTINADTNDKVKVTYKLYVGDDENTAAGTIKCNNAVVSSNLVTYNMDSVSRTLTFTENPDYQFLYWETNAPDDFIFTTTNKTDKTVQFTLKNPNDSVTVTAFCAPRLNINNAEPANQNAGVQRDSDISLTFNVKPELNIKNFIRITCDGNSVNNSFKLSQIDNSSFSGNILTIKADASKRINVPVDGKSTVTVTVDSGAYYEYTAPDNNIYNITLGNDYTYEYTINEQTLNQAKVTYKVFVGDDENTAAGTIKCDDLSVPVSQVIYNMDAKTRSLSFTEKPDYQFLYWETTDSTAIQLKETTIENKQTSFEPIGPGSSVIIKAVCAPRLTISAAEPAKQTAGVERDNDIILTFSEKPELDIKDKIRITCDGYSISSSFKISEITDASFTDKTLTIEADTSNRLTVPSGSKKTINVTVNSDAYYKYTAPNSKTYDVTLGKDSSHEYIINENTKKQAKVTYKVYVGNTETAAAGTIKCDNVPVPSSQVTYNMDSITRTISFEETVDYQFLYWETSSSAAIQMNSDTIENTQTSFIPTGEGSNIIIKAVCAPRLKLSATSIPAFSSEGVPCDTGIELYLSQKPALALLKSNISIYCNGSSVKENFPISGWTLSDTATNGLYTLSITPDTTNRISVQTGNKPNVTVTIPAQTYYIYTAPNNKTYNVTCGTNQSHEYKINSNTRQKAKVLFQIYDSDGTTEITSGIAGTITCDGASPSSSGITYDMDGVSRTLAFTEKEDYQFLYWTSTNSIISINSNTKENKTSSFTPVGTGTTSPSSDIIIKAICAKRPRVTAFSPAYNEDGIDQDSIIKITFDKDPVNYSAIKVYRNDVQDTTHFTDRSVSSNVLTISTSEVTTSTGRFITSGTQNVKVEIPAGLYYTCTSNNKDYNVTYGGSGRTDVYKINTDTRNKVTIKGPSSTLTSGTVSLSPARDDNKYSIGEIVYATFEPNTDYSLNSWTVSPSLTSTSALTLANSAANPAKITVARKSTTTSYTFTPSSTFATKISSVTPENSSTGVPLDTPLVIKFNKKMSFASLTKGTDIKLYDQYSNDISIYFNDPIVTTEDNKTVVTMKIKPDYSIREIFGNNNTAVIQVQLKSTLKGKDNISLSTSDYTVQNGFLTLMYRINKQTEDDLPYISNDDLDVYVDVYGENRRFSPYSVSNKFSVANHIYDHLCYNLTLKDDTSGIAGKMDINVKVIYDVDGNPIINGKQLSKTVFFEGCAGGEYTCASGILNFSTDFGEDKIEDDCMIQVDFVIYDVAGNSATRTYYVAMDKTLDINDAFIYNRFATGYSKTAWNTTTIQANASTYDTPGTDIPWIGNDNWEIITLPDNTSQALYSYVYVRYPQSQKFITFNGTDYSDSIINCKIYYSTDRSQVENKTASVATLSASNRFMKENYEFFVFPDIQVSRTSNTFLNIEITDSSGGTSSKILTIKASPVAYLDGTSIGVRNRDGSNADKLKIYCTTAPQAVVTGAPESGKSYIYETKSTWTPYYDMRSLPSEAITYNSSPASSTEISGLKLVKWQSDGLGSESYTLTLKIINSSSFNYNKDIFFYTTYAVNVFNSCFMDSSGNVNIKLTASVFKNFLSNKTVNMKSCQTGKKETDVKAFTVDCSSSSQSLPTSFASVENISPKAGDCWAIQNFGDGLFYSNFYDKDSGLVTIERGGKTYFKFEYIVVPYRGSQEDIPSFVSTIKNDFDYYNPITDYTAPLSVSGDEGDFEIFMPRVPCVKDYLTIIRVKDKNGNSYITSASLGDEETSRIYGNNIPLQIEKSGATQFKFTSVYKSEYTSRRYYYVMEKYNSTAELWEPNIDFIVEDEYSCYYDTPFYPNLNLDCQGKSEGQTVTVTQNGITNGAYYRTILYSDKNNSVPIYYYSTPVTCGVKNMIDGITGISILCDKPTLYYCCFSPLDYGDNQDQWEMCGGHTRTVYTTSSINVDTSLIPKGMKYVVIAHFADNTSVMSSVMTK